VVGWMRCEWDGHRVNQLGSLPRNLRHFSDKTGQVS
jgi:hypothetical protein